MTEGELSRREREAMLERASRPSALIGANIPESVSIAGELVPLRSVVEAVAAREPPTQESVSEARRLATILEREADGVANSLMRDPDLTRGKAEALCSSIIGLRRAAKVLRAAGREREFGSGSVAEAEVEDAKRWVQFLKALR